jgi:dihydroorotase
MDSLMIRRPDDFHVHLRSGPMLNAVVPFTAQYFARALVMPNLMPSISTASDVSRYREEIRRANTWGEAFEPLMTAYLKQTTTPEDIKSLKQADTIAMKLYPLGATTNSSEGVSDLSKLTDTFKAMEAEGMVLCIHGESPDKPALQREEQYVWKIELLHDRHPDLKIVVEHISNASTARAVSQMGKNVAATITLHHLLLTTEDIIGGKLNPHAFCRPIPKSDFDREILLRYATSGDNKFFFGSDSAPHPKQDKECCGSAAGVWSAPVALPLLAQVFESAGALDKLEDFTSRFGAEFYGLPLNQSKAYLARHTWTVPSTIHNIVPFWAGKEINWSAS